MKQVPVTLVEYSMNSVTEGIDAIVLTRVLIRGLDLDNTTHTSTTTTQPLTRKTVSRTFRYCICICVIYIESNLQSYNTFFCFCLSLIASGTAASMDIVIASVRAYIGALNKMLGFKNRANIVYSSAERESIHV